jgi:hypothetical protein
MSNYDYSLIIEAVKKDQSKFLLEHPDILEPLTTHGIEKCVRAYELFEKHKSIARVSKEMNLNIVECRSLITAFGQYSIGLSLGDK